MNRSSSEAHEANAPGLWSHARQLLRAFADAGQRSVTGVRLFVGPNGVLAWTEPAQVDRSEPYVSHSARCSGEVGCARGSPIDGYNSRGGADGKPDRHLARGSCLQLAARNLMINMI